MQDSMQPINHTNGNGPQSAQSSGAPQDDRDIVLQAENITKRFPGVLANDNVNLTLRRGEILALLGENGAGKSTLMNIIYGLYHPDEGSVKVKGQPVHFISPREAIHTGIGMVHQHFQLIPVMTVAENVILGAEETVDTQKVHQPFDERPIAGMMRLLWGAFWRLLIPIFAILLGLLVAQVGMLLLFAIFPHVASPEIKAALDQFDPMGRANIDARAITGLSLFYPDNPTLTTILLWLPAVIACIVAAFVVIRGYQYAKKTWRGRNLTTEHESPLDNIIDAAIDLIGISYSIQNRKRAADRVRQISHDFGLDVDPNAIVENLPVGTQQRVEIVKALYRHADILILDEPTAVLTPQESRELFKIMKDLASHGVSIIFITHKLKEVFAVADNIVVMRGGKVVGEAAPKSATESTLAAMMVGREVILRVSKSDAIPGDVVLDVQELHAKDDRHAMALDGVRFDVRAGEVVGIAGVQGNGQTELVEVLTGLRKATSGKITLLGKLVTHASPRDITVLGAAHVPEDRQRHGMVKPFSVADNLVLNQYYNAPFSGSPSWRELPFAILAYAIVFSALALVGTTIWMNGLFPSLSNFVTTASAPNPKAPAPYLVALFATMIFSLVWIVVSHFVTIFALSRVARLLRGSNQSAKGGLAVNGAAIMENAKELIKAFDIRTPSPTTNAGNLSGGNQQKMVVAREFSRKPPLLIASQPTRGIDVGSIEFIHQQIVKQRDEGAAVLLVSAELDEIMALSDRIAVMYKGHIIATVDAKSATREQLGLLMAGIQSESEPSAATA